MMISCTLLCLLHWLPNQIHQINQATPLTLLQYSTVEYTVQYIFYESTESQWSLLGLDRPAKNLFRVKDNSTVQARRGNRENSENVPNNKPESPEVDNLKK